MSVPVTLPQLGETVAEGTILKWLKAEGDSIEKEELLFEVSTDKVDSEIPAPVTGIVGKIQVPEGETVPVGTVLVEILEVGEDASSGASPTEAPAEAPASAPQAQPGPSVADHEVPEHLSTGWHSPIVRKLAKEHNVDLLQVVGTGEKGRVSKKDVLAFVDSRGAAPAAVPVATTPVAVQKPTAPTAPPKARPGEEIIPVTVHRQKIAEHMVASRRVAAHVTAVVEVDMSNVVAIRSKHKEEFKKREGLNLTYMPFLCMAVVEALQHFPLVNSSLADPGHLIQRHYVNLGIAVAIEETNDLIVPVIKHAEEKNLVGLTRSIYDLATRTRDGGLTPDDVSGATFTITNPGVFGSIMGTPIIPKGLAGILSFEAVEDRVVAIDGQVAIRPMVYLPLSYDHRVMDGMGAAKFLGRVKSNLETWDFAEELSY